MVPGDARVLGPNTGVGAEMLWKGNSDRHQWHRRREGAGLLLMSMKIMLLVILRG